MKHLRSLLLSGSALASLFCIGQQNVAINATGAPPAANVLLDVSSTTKGMLIPRVPDASALPTTTEGLTVYQTGAPKGFYYCRLGTWLQIGTATGTKWELTGNTMTAPALTNPNPDFFGTNDNTDLVFRTNNIERMRIKATSGFVGVFTNNPLERLDINGGLRISAPLVTSGNAAMYSATSSPGVISFYPKDGVNPITGYYINASNDTILFPGHWGNISGVAQSATANSTSGGWRRLVNDYDEAYNKAWTHHRVATCAAGTSTIPRSITPVSTSTLAAATAERVSPFRHPGASLVRRFRVQYVYTATEVDVERNQLIAGGDPAATEGLCRNQPINSISFNILSGTVPISTVNAASYLTVTVKNVPVGLGNAVGITGFDNGIDPNQGCGSIRFGSGVTAPVGWFTINLTTPFRWDGTGGVLVEVAGQQFEEALGDVQVQATPVARTYGAYSFGVVAPGSACNPSTALNTNAPCYTSSDYANNMADACTGNLASTYRPIIRFNGTVSNTPAQTTSGTANFLLATGGFISEVPVAAGVQPWGRQTTPYYAFKGAGTISAQRGIFDEGLRLNDHVFDRAFDGRVAPQDAKDFGDERTVPIAEMAEHTRTERHLPTIRGREDWNAEGGFSLGDLTNQLWVTAETQALYLTDLHDRLNALEVLSNDRPLQPAEAANTRKVLCTMPELSDAQKALLAKELKDRTTNSSTH